VADARDLKRHLLVVRAGCPWRLLPKDLPPWETIYRWFAAWRDDGRFERMNHALVMADRERVGRAASPSAAIIDSQSVKTTEAGGPRGYDAGKKVNGRKRHALVDTDGRGLVIEPHPASIQDRAASPFIQRVFADSGYAGEKVAKATLIAVEIVRKNPGQVGFSVTRDAWSSSGSSRGSGTIPSDSALMTRSPDAHSPASLSALATVATSIPGLRHSSRISLSLCRVASNFRMPVFKRRLIGHGPSSVRCAKFLCPLFVRHWGADVKNSSAAIRHVTSLMLFALNVALRTIAKDVPDALLWRIECFQLPDTALNLLHWS
jgi:transposase